MSNSFFTSPKKEVWLLQESNHVATFSKSSNLLFSIDKFWKNNKNTFKRTHFLLKKKKKKVC